MLILIGLAIITILLLVLGFLTESEISAILGVCVGFLLLIVLIIWPISYYDTLAEIQQFKAVENTIANARLSGKDLESVAFQMSISSSNQWLAKSQYWNNTIFDIFLPDELNKMEPIK